MKKKWLSVVCCLPLICGCSVLSVAPTTNSRFTSETVRLGMTKEKFVEQFGQPFKESFFRDENGVEYEASWHMRFTGISGRIFFVPDYTDTEMLVCYIGKKLPNATYPT